MRLDATPPAPFLAPDDLTRATRARIDALSQEVATGRTRDAGRALRSDFSDLSRLSAALERLDAEAVSLGQAARWGDALQNGLERLGSAAATVSGVLDASLSLDPAFLSDQAAAVLRDMAGVLNTTLGERSLFAAGGQDGALPDAQAVLDDVAAIAGGSVDYADYAAQVDAYFAPGGGLDARLASMPADPIDFPAPGGGRVAIDVSVASIEIRGLMGQVALVAGLSAAPFDLGPNSEQSLDLAARFAEAQGELPKLRGRLGAVEARISELQTQTDAARADTEMAIADRVGVDPYETATKLQNDLSRLETLFAITARRSQLRLTDYL